MALCRINSGSFDYHISSTCRSPVDFRKIPEEKHFVPLKACLYFVGAGAVGNMIDRVFRKYVVDFIYFSLINFPVFNVADIYVTVAAFMLVVLILFFYQEEDLNRVFSKKKEQE